MPLLRLSSFQTSREFVSTLPSHLRESLGLPVPVCKFVSQDCQSRPA